MDIDDMTYRDLDRQGRELTREIERVRIKGDQVAVERLLQKKDAINRRKRELVHVA